MLVQLSETISAICHWNQKVEGDEVSFRNESISSRRSTRSGLLIQLRTNRVLNVFSSSCEINGVILLVMEFSASKSISIAPQNCFRLSYTDISSRRSGCTYPSKLLFFSLKKKKERRRWMNRKRSKSESSIYEDLRVFLSNLIRI